jgi:HEAT repeat protein/protein-S-isoprenylcysteine O-methyltransferase Ste14
MFFLGGLGFLRLLWLPFLDVSFNLFRLGDIINLPFKILLGLYSLTGLGRWLKLSYILTGLGLLIFFLGTLTWFYARTQKKGVADLWVYRSSRHPQYLGWIIWSYGVMFLPSTHNIKLCYELSNSLPWLLSTMIIVGVAMLEEVKMKQAFGDAYESYRRRAPFLIPLPRFLARASAFPLRLMFKKPYPERKREIAAMLAVYMVIFLGISAFYGGLVSLPGRQAEVSEQRIKELARVLKGTDSRGEKRRAAEALSGMGEPAVDSLLALLKDQDAIIRAYSAGALGGIESERVVAPLIELLSDADSYVRRTAAASLGRTGSSRAIRPLIEALEDPARDMAGAAIGALGQIRHPDVVPILIKALQNPVWNAADAAARALGEQGVQEAVGPLIQCFEEMPDCPYHLVGTALWKLNSERAVDAWIAGLKKGSWWYPRAACAAELGKNKLEKGLEPLQDALKDESPEVRRAAVLALMEFRSEKTVESLRDALKDTDFEVRMYAKEALKKIEKISCTIVMAARDGLVLVGNNEDRNHLQTIVTFLPASGGNYGRIIFGYDDAPVQGGMNDQGLFIDGNALRPTGWKPDPGKPTFNGNVMMVVLGKCATCEDVQAFFEKSNFPALERARFPVADRSGASMVVEYGRGGVQFIKSDTWYQIATNFVMSNITDRNYPCWRYKTADKMLSEAKSLSVDLIREVLEKTHQEGGGLTVYSNIYDLKKGLIHVYNLRNFKEAVVLDLAEELKKGERRIQLPSLFKPAMGTSRTGYRL